MNDDGSVTTLLLKRAACLGVGWAAGWVVYMIAMVLTVYDGILSMIFQPIIAAFCSAAILAAAVVVGAILRVPLLWRLWTASRIPAILLMVGSLSMLCFGYSLRFRSAFIDPETQIQVETLHPGVGLASYFLLLFAFANWPIAKPKSSSGWAALI